MYLQCTKALLDKLKVKRTKLLPIKSCEDGAEGFYSWHAHFFTVNRHKVIVCMNNLTRYTVVLYRPKARDIAKLENRIKEGIRTVFREEGIAEEIIDEYIERCGALEYSKTAGRGMEEYLNKICKIVQRNIEFVYEDTLIQRKISLIIGEYPMEFDRSFGCPTKMVFQELGKMRSIPESEWSEIRRVENYQLKIRLNIEKTDIWRRILIPSRCTFQSLHRVIQEIFGWFDLQPHEFYLLGEPAEFDSELLVYKYPIKVRIVDGEDPEAEEYFEPGEYEVKFDTKIRLKDVFKDTDTCIYTYDFSDNWQHVITLEKVIENNNCFPILLERKGTTPPEDISDEDGFEEEMSIVFEENCLEYEEMVRWSEILNGKERTIEEINGRIKGFNM